MQEIYISLSKAQLSTHSKLYQGLQTMRPKNPTVIVNYDACGFNFILVL